MTQPLYREIYKVVRAKMRKDEETLPDDDPTMVEDTETLVPLLLGKIQKAGVPGNYGALAGDQKTFFDRAAGRIVAARIRPTLLASENDGAGVIIESEVGDVRKRFGAYTSRAPGTVGTKPLEEQWIDEANELLAELCKQTRPPRPGFGSFVATPGRRRAEEAATGYRAIDVRELLIPTRNPGRRII